MAETAVEGDKETGTKADRILNAVIDHVTRHGSEADDALRAKVFELSGGKVGSAAKGTVDENADA